MNLIKIPYPKSNLENFLTVMIAISLTVIFILTVLQPFGTARFQHEYKYVLLSGYGVVILLGSVLYYFVSDLILSDTVKDRWSIIHESIFLLGNIMFCLCFCFLYWSFAFRSSFHTNQFLSFMLSASSVAIFPVAAYFLFIYSKFKEVVMVESTLVKPSVTSSLTIIGTNKSEKVDLNPDHLLFVESNNNYVILNILQEDKVTRKMIRCTLNNLLSQLDDNFIKCHRSYIVNLNKIMNLTGNVTNSRIELVASEAKIPVSRGQVDGLRQLLGK